MEKVHLHHYLAHEVYCYTTGLWYCVSGEDLPSLTFVGSSNFGWFVYKVFHNVNKCLLIGKRSLAKDIEAQVAMATSNHYLRESLFKVLTVNFYC